jgi:hypothetical protein
MIMQQDLETLIAVIRDQRELIYDLKAKETMHDISNVQSQRGEHQLEKFKNMVNLFMTEHCFTNVWESFQESYFRRMEENNDE